eukprot:3633581-Prymnesium_polylepis.1
MAEMPPARKRDASARLTGAEQREGLSDRVGHLTYNAGKQPEIEQNGDNSQRHLPIVHGMLPTRTITVG